MASVGLGRDIFSNLFRIERRGKEKGRRVDFAEFCEGRRMPKITKKWNGKQKAIRKKHGVSLCFFLSVKRLHFLFSSSSFWEITGSQSGTFSSRAN